MAPLLTSTDRPSPGYEKISFVSRLPVIEEQNCPRLLAKFVWAKFAGLVAHRFIDLHDKFRFEPPVIKATSVEGTRRIGGYQACCIIPAALPVLTAQQ